MASAFDSSRIELACPHCRHKFREAIAKLKTSPKLACPSCHGSIQVDASQLAASLKQADQAIADFRRSIGRLGK